MIEFSAPWILYFLPLSAVPFVLNLVRGAKARRVILPTFPYLPDSRSFYRKRKFLSGLRTFLRFLMLFLLVLGFSGPVWVSSAKLPDKVQIVVDGSFSMKFADLKKLDVLTETLKSLGVEFKLFNSKPSDFWELPDLSSNVPVIFVSDLDRNSAELFARKNFTGKVFIFPVERKFPSASIGRVSVGFPAVAGSYVNVVAVIRCSDDGLVVRVSSKGRCVFEKSLKKGINTVKFKAYGAGNFEFLNFSVFYGKTEIARKVVGFKVFGNPVRVVFKGDDRGGVVFNALRSVFYPSVVVKSSAGEFCVNIGRRVGGAVPEIVFPPIDKVDVFAPSYGFFVKKQKIRIVFRNPDGFSGFDSLASMFVGWTIDSVWVPSGKFDKLVSEGRKTAVVRVGKSVVFLVPAEILMSSFSLPVILKRTLEGIFNPVYRKAGFRVKEDVVGEDDEKIYRKGSRISSGVYRMRDGRKLIVNISDKETQPELLKPKKFVECLEKNGIESEVFNLEAGGRKNLSLLIILIALMAGVVEFAKW